MNILKLINIAKDVSMLSDHHSHQIGAVVFDKRGKVVSISNNFLYKTHPEYSRLNALKTLHAEAGAILKIRNKTDLSGHNVLIFRQTKDGKMANAKPCEGCMKLIRLYGLKKIYYTRDDQVWEENVS